MVAQGGRKGWGCEVEVGDVELSSKIENRNNIAKLALTPCMRSRIPDCERHILSGVSLMAVGAGKDVPNELSRVDWEREVCAAYIVRTRTPRDMPLSAT